MTARLQVPGARVSADAEGLLRETVTVCGAPHTTVTCQPSALTLALAALGLWI